MNFDCSLYLVVGRKFLRNISVAQAVEEAILGGVTMIQLREKELSTREYYEEALEVKKVTDKFDIPLLINDRLDIALAVNASGVHLGQSDMPIEEARKIMGSHKIIGGTVRSIEQAIRAKEEEADYLGTGAVYPTGSKDDVSRIIGVEELKKIVDAVQIPKVAIGGINSSNAAPVLSTGIEGIAVISAILASDDIRRAAMELNQMINASRAKYETKATWH